MTTRKNTLTAAVLLLCLPLTSCEVINQTLAGLPATGGTSSPFGGLTRLFPGSRSGGRGNATSTIIAVLTVAAIAYAASQQQQKLAQQSVARRPTSVKKAKTKYVAVAVPKKDGTKGKDMIIVDKETKKPVNQKAYELKPGQTAKAGQKIKVGGFAGIGGYEATALDTVHGV